MKKWKTLEKKMTEGNRVIYSDPESFGIYIDLDGGRQQNIGLELTGIGKRQFLHMFSVICEVKQADVSKLVEMVSGLPIGRINVVDGLISLDHNIAWETLDEDISSFTSFDTVIYAALFLANKADEIQKILKIKDDSY